MHLRLTSAAVCLLGLDDPVKLKELRREGIGITVIPDMGILSEWEFDVDHSGVEFLRRSFRDRLEDGWDVMDSARNRARISLAALARIDAAMREADHAE